MVSPTQETQILYPLAQPLPGSAQPGYAQYGAPDPSYLQQPEPAEPAQSAQYWQAKYRSARTSRNVFIATTAAASLLSLALATAGLLNRTSNSNDAAGPAPVATTPAPTNAPTDTAPVDPGTSGDTLDDLPTATPPGTTADPTSPQGGGTDPNDGSGLSQGPGTGTQDGAPNLDGPLGGGQRDLGDSQAAQELLRQLLSGTSDPDALLDKAVADGLINSDLAEQLKLALDSMQSQGGQSNGLGEGNRGRGTAA
ncbi:MAG: hypothetical protein ACOYEV_05375 [Candidatus Nanopelagicales bacterium]